MQPKSSSPDELLGARPARAALSLSQRLGDAGKRGGLEGPWGLCGRAFWSDFLFRLPLSLYHSAWPGLPLPCCFSQGDLPGSVTRRCPRGQLRSQNNPHGGCRGDAPSAPPLSFFQQLIWVSANLGCEGSESKYFQLCHPRGLRHHSQPRPCSGCRQYINECVTVSLKIFIYKSRQRAGFGRWTVVRQPLI